MRFLRVLSPFPVAGYFITSRKGIKIWKNTLHRGLVHFRQGHGCSGQSYAEVGGVIAPCLVCIVVPCSRKFMGKTTHSQQNFSPKFDHSTPLPHSVVRSPFTFSPLSCSVRHRVRSPNISVVVRYRMCLVDTVCAVCVYACLPYALGVGVRIFSGPYVLRATATELITIRSLLVPLPATATSSTSSSSSSS